MKTFCTILAVTICLILLLAPASVIGQNLCEHPPIKINQRPDPDGPPTEVSIGIYIADITAVDDVAQTLTGDFIVLKQWRDERLAEQVGCRFSIADVWTPELELLNSSLMTQKQPIQRNQVGVEEGGLVSHYQRYFGAVSTYHRLEKFPFDDQVFKLRMSSTHYDIDDVVLTVNKDMTRVSDIINIPDWTIEEVHAHIVAGDSFGLGNIQSTYILEIPAERNSNFYVWKVLVPLTLIVMMSWVVFWINPVKFGSQLGISATSMLTLIAFQFSQTGVLPKLSYFTIMDKLILGSSVLVFFSFFESALAICLVAENREEDAFKLDKICRWIFPLSFILYWIYVIFL